MAVVESGFAGGLILGIGIGVGIGVGIAIVAPRLFPETVANARPLAKKALREAVTAYERGREALAEMSEYADDMLAEVKSDIATERMREAAANAAAAGAAARARKEAEATKASDDGQAGMAGAPA